MLASREWSLEGGREEENLDLELRTAQGKVPEDPLLLEIVLGYASFWRCSPCIAGLGSLTSSALLMGMMLISPEGEVP